MGDIADMLIDSMWEDYDLFYESIPDAKCKGCNSTNVQWEIVGGKWSLLNLNGAPHRCGKYQLPLDALKHLYSEKIQTTKQRQFQLLFQKCIKSKNISNFMVFLSDSELIELYCKFSIEASSSATRSYTLSIYANRQAELKSEILRRMK